MKWVVGLGGAFVTLLLVPLLVVAAVVGAFARVASCQPGERLAAEAPVPAEARHWVELVRAECPELPAPWVAAMMAQESSFRPAVFAHDVNGGTWGLFQISQPVWQQAYGGPWSSDRDGDGVWDVKQPEIHSTIAGQYLCDRLATVRSLLARNPQWPAAQELSDLDTLVVAHNAGEGTLARYPAIPAITRDYLDRMRERTASWAEPGSAPGCATPGAPSQVVVAPGTPHDVAHAVRTAMSFVGVTSGWYNLCDKLACRIYGYANSGYDTALVHWNTMRAQGHAHPGDRCPPVGSFVFWTTSHPAGHVATVVQSDPGCRLDHVKVVTNGSAGGVHLTTVAELTGGSMKYLGWSQPVCRGALIQ